MISISGLIINLISKSTSSSVRRASVSSKQQQVIHQRMSSDEKPTVMFVLGGPGAGKGTQCANLVKVNFLFMTFLCF